MIDIENDEMRKTLTFVHEFWAMNPFNISLLLTELLNLEYSHCKMTNEFIERQYIRFLKFRDCFEISQDSLLERIKLFLVGYLVKNRPGYYTRGVFFSKAVFFIFIGSPYISKRL